MHCFDSVITRDLEPFEKSGGITEDLFEKVRSRASHYQIIKHRLYRRQSTVDCIFPYRLVINWIFSFNLMPQLSCGAEAVCFSAVMLLFFYFASRYLHTRWTGLCHSCAFDQKLLQILVSFSKSGNMPPKFTRGQKLHNFEPSFPTAASK